MALKAGRVGVAPDQVDEFGNVKSEATAGYTKQEADAKFETQTHAASTYETKMDASNLQPINLAVPISMLDGTKLTVETALQGLQNTKMPNQPAASTVGDIVTGATVQTNEVLSIGIVTYVTLYLSGVTAAAYAQIGVIPEGFRPRLSQRFINAENKLIYVDSSGKISCGESLSDAGLHLCCSYVKSF